METGIIYILGLLLFLTILTLQIHTGTYNTLELYNI